ncbi:hypothetical protein TD95_001835 [Thielaviopsis punctulata]|uniref:Uncharacterized protein n=1 Tax=Thielaviopsis punctulata TaxID=72032 RepID=A0A0F4ZCI2_9PEZI|nr:hypothetical protein TD95_001835 [Thielaviopsis punctulata]
MPSISHLAKRMEEEDTNGRNFNMLLSVMGLVFFGMCLASSLILMRRTRLRRQAAFTAAPPSYSEARGNNHLTIQTTDANGRSSILFIGSNGKPMLSNPNSPPHSPDNVPEIRITFPDETDENGRNQSGRVVVVRMGEKSVGMEPLKEQLPAYEKDSKTQFVSIDMDQIGGLKEKETRP